MSWESHQPQTCETCGSVYAIQSQSLPMRDKDSIDCEVCGATLRSWNGAAQYDATLTSRAPWPKETLG